MSEEITRQYRVARQMIDMHARLRDRFHRRALVLDLMILAGAVLFAATTLADEHAFVELGIAPRLGVNFLRIASIVLFFASVVSLRVDWKGLEGRHDDAVRRLAEVVGELRLAKDADGRWSDADLGRLGALYTEVMGGLIPIPPNLFPRLKARYAHAVEVSRLLDARPGYPSWLAGIVVSWRAIRGKT